MQILRFIFYFILTAILFLLISNGVRAAKEIENEDERKGALSAQLMLFIVRMLSTFLYFN